MRLHLDAPIQIVFTDIEIDKVESFDIESGRAVLYLSLLLADGTPRRSEPITVTLSADQCKQLDQWLLREVKRENKFRIDRQKFDLAGSVVGVPRGSEG